MSAHEEMVGEQRRASPSTRSSRFLRLARLVTQFTARGCNKVARVKQRVCSRTRINTAGACQFRDLRWNNSPAADRNNAMYTARTAWPARTPATASNPAVNDQVAHVEPFQVRDQKVKGR